VNLRKQLMKAKQPVKLALPVCTGLVLIAAQFGLSSAALAAGCPAVTVADMKGVPAGMYPQQYELAEFQSLAKCTMSFKGNPDAAALNKRIFGNPKLPSLAERQPAEPLVVAPYD
jgi:peptide/nickel transport system substrate-binding protein